MSIIASLCTFYIGGVFALYAQGNQALHAERRFDLNWALIWDSFQWPYDLYKFMRNK